MFSSNGGQLATLASLAQQAYHLAPGENIDTRYNNMHLNVLPEHLTSVQPRWLTPTDLPTLVPAPGSTNFPTKGLLAGGVYVNENAAALVGVTTDALFLTFRGTNDTIATGEGDWLLGGGTPDTDHWFDHRLLLIGDDEGMAEHYALFAPLIAAITTYLIDNPLLKVYVSGHSLGAAMAQQYMLTHLGSRYEAVLFASPGYEFGSGEDLRISNIWLDGDAINKAAWAGYNSGDDNTIFHNITPTDGGENLHSMDLYARFQDLLSENLITRANLSDLGGIDYDRYYAHTATASGTGLVGAGNNTVTGSGFEDVILGGAGNDILNGGLGANAALFDGMTDRLYGGIGDDTFVINEARDVVIELALAGSDWISTSVLSINLNRVNYANVENVILNGGTSALNATGNSLANRLIGNAGTNSLSGMAGNDILRGGAGSDRFVFNTTPHTTTNSDRISDFNALSDLILLENSVFTALGIATGTLAVSQFWSSLTGLAHLASDRIIYETDTGSLSYDIDGTGSALAVRFATLTNLPAGLGAEDFLII